MMSNAFTERKYGKLKEKRLKSALKPRVSDTNESPKKKVRISDPNMDKGVEVRKSEDFEVQSSIPKKVEETKNGKY